jgi:predicted DNA-binding transcriptional regulator AlpA
MSKRQSPEVNTDAGQATFGDKVMISGPKLRAALSISAPTLWRWRSDAGKGFPKAKYINGRLYFPWHEVRAWLERQPDAA